MSGFTSAEDAGIRRGALPSADDEGSHAAAAGPEDAKERHCADQRAGDAWNDTDKSSGASMKQSRGAPVVVSCGEMDLMADAEGAGAPGERQERIISDAPELSEATEGIWSDLAAALTAMEEAVAVCARIQPLPPSSKAHAPHELAGGEASFETRRHAAERAEGPEQTEPARIREWIARAAAASRAKAGARVVSDAETGRTETRPDVEMEVAKREEEALMRRKAEARARLTLREEEERVKREAKVRRKREAKLKEAQRKAGAARTDAADLSALGATELDAVANSFLSSVPIAPEGLSCALQAVLDNDRCTEQPRAEIPRRSGGRQKRAAAENRRRADVRWLRHTVTQVDAHAKSTLGGDWLEQFERNIALSRRRFGYSIS